LSLWISRDHQKTEIGDTGKECRSLVVDLVSLRQNIDTPLPAGRLTFQILDAVRKILVYTTVQTRLTVDLSTNRGLTFLPFGVLSVTSRLQQIQSNHLESTKFNRFQ
jgi:hypothetical protein